MPKKVTIIATKFWKYCPVCLSTEFKIDRDIVKTCGSKACMRQWRLMSTEQKARLIQQAYIKKLEVEETIRGVENDELQHELQITPEMHQSIEEQFAEREREFLQQQATRPAEPHIPAKHFTPPGKTVQRDNEVLERLFGPDAPGIVREDTEDDKDKEK